LLNKKKLKIKEKKMATSNNSHSNSCQLIRNLRISCIAALLIVVIGGALSIPFIYESQTLWYKIGVDKTMLRAGQIAGLLAVILLFVQIILAVRGKFLQELFGLPSLMKWHRVNGVLVFVLVLCHVTLVLAPEGFLNLPIGMKYWPELVGLILFLIIFAMVVSSLLRQQLGFAYVRWRTIHKSLGYLALVLVAIHVLFVSESFEHSIPRTGLIAAVATVVIVVFRVKTVALQKKRKQ
jgi:DMSO/TMAO reductase YedYZ heme-binding membrane subunit